MREQLNLIKEKYVTPEQMWFVCQIINRQLALHGNYFRLANCRAKIRRNILRDI